MSNTEYNSAVAPSAIDPSEIDPATFAFLNTCSPSNSSFGSQSTLSKSPMSNLLKSPMNSSTYGLIGGNSISSRSSSPYRRRSSRRETSPRRRSPSPYRRETSPRRRSPRRETRHSPYRRETRYNPRRHSPRRETRPTRPLVLPIRQIVKRVDLNKLQYEKKLLQDERQQLALQQATLHTERQQLALQQYALQQYVLQPNTQFMQNYAERLHAERLHAERLHAERLEEERIYEEHLHAERLEEERLHAERIHAKLNELEIKYQMEETEGKLAGGPCYSLDTVLVGSNEMPPYPSEFVIRCVGTKNYHNCFTQYEKTLTQNKNKINLMFPIPIPEKNGSVSIREIWDRICQYIIRKEPTLMRIIFQNIKVYLNNNHKDEWIIVFTAVLFIHYDKIDRFITNSHV